MKDARKINASRRPASEPSFASPRRLVSARGLAPWSGAAGLPERDDHTRAPPYARGVDRAGSVEPGSRAGPVSQVDRGARRVRQRIAPAVRWAREPIAHWLGELERDGGSGRGVPGIRGWFGHRRVQLASVITLAFLPIAVLNATHLEVSVVVAFLLGLLSALPMLLLAWRTWVAWAVAAGMTWFIGSVIPLVDSDPWPWPTTNGLVLLCTVVAVAATARMLVTIPVSATSALLVGSMSAPDTQIGWGVGVLLFAAGGLVIRWRIRFRRELDRQEEVSEVEKARRTVLEERARIARDLHDVVAHRMSLVVVAAETAPYRIADVSEPMRTELAAISTTAREALSELRGLLGVLRSADDRPLYAPQPVLADVTALVDGAARAGLDVHLMITGPQRPLRSAVELGAYRIVQESLANAARHAPGAQVEVRLSYEPTGLRLDIVNGPSNHSQPGAAGVTGPPAPPGHGLTGMAERAAVVDGVVAAAPTAAGGFRVTAVLPTVQEN
jgi:signal transduction histidine kinase